MNDEEKLNGEVLLEILRKKDEYQKKLKQLEKDEYFYKHRHEIDLAVSCTGKCYRYTWGGTGMMQIFRVNTYERGTGEVPVFLRGELITFTTYLIGDMILTANNNARVEANSISSSEWEEISEGEYLEMKKNAIKAFTRDLKDES